mmetsp:Transcript_14879/g.37971  ORF Transcript_14879/g.37971 Transcript_14879/m.37971 type:complete len:248 (+) Transcript_14879:943-1686(+)
MQALIRGFMQMNVKGKVVLLAKTSEHLERRVRNRIGGVRRIREVNVLEVPKLISCLMALRKILILVCRVGRRKVNHNHPDHCPDPGLYGHPRRRVNKPVHIVEAGGAPSNHFRNGEPRAIFAEGLLGDERHFGGPNRLREPLHERLVIGFSFQQREAGMCVGVDEARGQNMRAEADEFGFGIFLDSCVMRKDFNNNAVPINCNSVVFENFRSFWLNWGDPARGNDGGGHFDRDDGREEDWLATRHAV